MHPENFTSAFLRGASFIAEGTFTVENLTRGGISVVRNRVVDQGLDFIVAVVLGTTSKAANFYLAPFAGNVTPSAWWTADNFSASATEFTNYTESTRQKFEPGTVADGKISNLNDRAEITIGSGNQETIQGIGILTSSTKEGQSGVLLSAARLPTARDNLVEGDVIAIGYSFEVSNKL